jgi:hypothetical protein
MYVGLLHVPDHDDIVLECLKGSKQTKGRGDDGRDIPHLFGSVMRNNEVGRFFEDDDLDR